MTKKKDADTLKMFLRLKEIRKCKNHVLVFLSLQTGAYLFCKITNDFPHDKPQTGSKVQQQI